MPSVVGLEVSTKERFGFNITSLVQKWHNQQSNNGMAIRSLYGGDPFTVYGEDAGASEENALLEINYYYTQPNIINDTVYIRNVANKKYLNVYVPENSTGVIPTIQFCQSCAEQEWNIINLHNGYFRIEDAAKGYSLTFCEDDTLYVAVMPSGSVDIEYQQWRLIPENGGYVIAPRASYDPNTSFTNTLCMAAEGSNGDAVDVGIDSRLDNTTSNEVWSLMDIDTTNHVKAKVYFDRAYVSRYGGDSNNESARIATVRTRLYNHMIYLQERYTDDFAIHIDFEIAQNPFSCYACDACNICQYDPANPPSDRTDCVNRGTLSQTLTTHMEHHTNYQNIGRVIREDPSISENIVTIVFIGHDTCKEDNPSGDSHFNRTDGCAYNGLTPFGNKMVLMIFNRNQIAKIDNDQTTGYKILGEYEQPGEGFEVIYDNYEYERETVLHEFGHVFLAPDHYTTDNGNDYVYTLSEVNSLSELYSNVHPSDQYANVGKGLYTSQCIYGTDRFNAMENSNSICAGCQKFILAHADRFS